MKLAYQALVLTFLSLMATACVTPNAAETPATRVKPAGKSTKVVKKSKEPSAQEFSFGTQTDFNNRLYNEGRRNRYSIAFE